MLVPPDARVRSRSIWLAEPRPRDARHPRPEALRGFKVKTLMEIDGATQPRFVDSEEPTKPRTAEAHHLRIAVREPHRAICLGTLAAVERGAGDQEGAPAERARSRRAGRAQLLAPPESRRVP